MLTSSQAAELLDASQPQLKHLITGGKLHAVTNPSGGFSICKESLMPARNGTDFQSVMHKCGDTD